MSKTDEKEAGARLRGTVRVSLPARIAYNPEALKTTIGSLLQRLGCPECFSGADCFFKAERDFLIREDNELVFRAREDLPEPCPWFAVPNVSSTLKVSLAPGDQFDIDKVLRAVDAVISRVGGCLPCHSGFDVSYLNEIGFLGIDPEGQPTQFGGSTANGRGELEGFGD